MNSIIRAAVAAASLGAPMAAIIATPAFAQTASQPAAAERTYKIGALTITGPWTRATPKGAPVAGGYLRITNNGKESDRLVGGAFERARHVEVHEMAMDGDIMRMRELREGLEIAPGQTVELRPGGYHLMFMKLTAPVTVGQPIRGRLVFQKAGALDVEFDVAPLGATKPGAAGHGHGAGGHGR